MDKKLTSKFLSLILRHRPESVGLELDPYGWVDIEALIEAMRVHDHPVDRSQLEEIVETNNKQRFAIEGNRIRANQGHSLAVDLDLNSTIPPIELFHGTSTRNLGLILEQGLKKMNRQHVHLSKDQSIAKNVGTRHGKPVVLRVDTELMVQQGYEFAVSKNGVWLVDHVPPEFLSEIGDLS